MLVLFVFAFRTKSLSLFRLFLLFPFLPYPFEIWIGIGYWWRRILFYVSLITKHCNQGDYVDMPRIVMLFLRVDLARDIMYLRMPKRYVSVANFAHIWLEARAALCSHVLFFADPFTIFMSRISPCSPPFSRAVHEYHHHNMAAAASYSGLLLGGARGLGHHTSHHAAHHAHAASYKEWTSATPSQSLVDASSAPPYPHGHYAPLSGK